MPFYYVIYSTFPKRCPYPVFKNFLDYTKFVGKECKNLNINAKQKLLKLSNSPFINDKVTHIGYPLTNKDPVCNLDFIDTDNLIPYLIFKSISFYSKKRENIRR